jgi:nucleotide-binding universal stress UspA family protein
MYKKMLVLLDGSKLAEVVFTYAQELSGRLNIDLELLHVCNPQEAEQLPMRQAYMEHMAEILQKKAEDIRSRSGDQGTGSKIQARGSVVVGYPAEEILKYADRNDIDLIMLSTHGRSGIRLWGLGSVANKVIHAAKVPVWLVPSEIREEVIYDKLPKKTMVIPLNGSRLAEGVIPHAINIAKQRGTGSDLVLVYVEPVPGLSPNLIDIKLIEDQKQRMNRYLEDMVKRVKETGVNVRAEILSGDAATAIINYVENNPTQLIAMATHGHIGISRMIFGSVTENILHLVKKTPIFLVRPSEQDQAI